MSKPRDYLIRYIVHKIKTLTSYRNPPYELPADSYIDAIANEMLDFLISYDSNEDFICGYCGKEVYGRFLYCSVECSDKRDKEIE